LTEEIQRLVRERVEAVREAIGEPPGGPGEAARAAAKVKAAREELSAMREVFAFAAAAIEAEDRAARSLLREQVLSGEMDSLLLPCPQGLEAPARLGRHQRDSDRDRGGKFRRWGILPSRGILSGQGPSSNQFST
jgi:hypothetical protein